MVSRGIPQLKHIRLYFCDFCGSSLGVRDFLNSEQLVNYLDKNEHLKLEIYLRRNHHPYISSTYMNGYIKDQSLRGMEEEEVLQEFVKFDSTFGRSALKHNSIKVSSAKKSIQGEWENYTWNRYPKHTIETFKEIPSHQLPYPDVRENKTLYRPPHQIYSINILNVVIFQLIYLTSFTRKRFVLPKYNLNKKHNLKYFVLKLIYLMSTHEYLTLITIRELAFFTKT